MNHVRCPKCSSLLNVVDEINLEKNKCFCRKCSHDFNLKYPQKIPYNDFIKDLDKKDANDYYEIHNIETYHLKEYPLLDSIFEFWQDNASITTVKLYRHKIVVYDNRYENKLKAYHLIPRRKIQGLVLKKYKSRKNRIPVINMPESFTYAIFYLDEHKKHHKLITDIVSLKDAQALYKSLDIYKSEGAIEFKPIVGLHDKISEDISPKWFNIKVPWVQDHKLALFSVFVLTVLTLPYAYDQFIAGANSVEDVFKNMLNFSKQGFFKAFFLVFLIADTLGFYFVLSNLVNKYKIHITYSWLQVGVSPLPLPFFTKKIKISDIEQIYIDRYEFEDNFLFLPNTKSRKISTRFSIHIILKNGDDKVLIDNISSYAQALRVEQSIENHLDIQDKPVKEEFIAS